MSNKVSKIRENAEANEKLKRYTLYGSLAGSIIVTIGKLCKITEDQMIKDFAKLSKDEEFYKCGNIMEACDYVINYYKMPEEYKKYIVLCYDEENKYTPLCTIMYEDGYLLPLDRDGNYLGVLAQDDFRMEYIFEPESKVEN